MRIIAGEFSSRRLQTLKGSATRPTLDKVREAVFSSLGGFFDGGICLDLYAGSGAIGLEALSRGMDQAILVDCSREAADIIRANVQSLQVEDRTRIMVMRDFKALSVLAAEGVKLSLVYLDPPYEKQQNEKVLSFLSEHEMLKPGAAAAVESDRKDVLPEQIGRLHFYKEAVYGIMKITYYRMEQGE
jgi:16S rRNA (guanine966-N2)-methyltransferase